MKYIILYAVIAGGAAYYTSEPVFTDRGACEARVKEMNDGPVGTWEYRCEEQAR